MANSPAHTLGQCIGDLVEEAIIKYIEPTAINNGLYLDYKHNRLARDNKKEVIWTDIDGNSHKLDIVLEKDGTELSIGTPKAFIEVAWRRYTKHSKNKVQEISGAIIPLFSKYKKYSPFIGVVLAGVFTNNSILQLKSQGFRVLYFENDTILKAFNKVGISLSWEENTATELLEELLQKVKALSEIEKEAVIEELFNLNKNELEIFRESLDLSIKRTIMSIQITSLHGISNHLTSIEEAINYINLYDENSTGHEFFRYTVIIKFKNGDKIEGEFQNKSDAVIFLNVNQKI